MAKALAKRRSSRLMSCSLSCSEKPAITSSSMFLNYRTDSSTVPRASSVSRMLLDRLSCLQTGQTVAGRAATEQRRGVRKCS